MRFINRIFAATAVLLSLAACEKSGSDRFLVQTETFSGERLDLSYSGCPMSGKTVTLTPDAADQTKATLKMAGVDWSAPTTKAPAEVKTIGLIPGHAEISIDVTLDVQSDCAAFMGEAEIEGYTIKVNGQFSKSGMTLAVETTVPENPLMGTYTLQNADEIPPITILWDADEFEFAGGTWDIQSFLLMSLPMIKIQEKTIPELLKEVLHSVTFRPDGNVTINYSPAGQPEVILDSPLNMAFYSQVTDNSFNLGLNVFGIAEEIAKMQSVPDTPSPMAIRAGEEPQPSDPQQPTDPENPQQPHQPVDLAKVINALQAEMNKAISNGIQLSYHNNPEQGDMSIYLDEKTLLPVLQAVKPIFEDPAMCDLILQVLAEIAPADMQMLISVFLKPVIVALPDVIDSTRSMEIGIRVVPETTEVAPTLR